MVATSRITVVVPTRNEAHNIGTFLTSLPPDVRLIVIDSSTDDTPRRIVADRPDNTTIVLAEANIPEARQLGADLVTTPWILYTDADVGLAPDYAEHLARLQLGPDVAGIAGSKLTAGGHEAYHDAFKAGQHLLDFIGIPAATGSNMLVRTDVLREVGGFDPALTVNEDTELMFRIKRAGYQIQYSPELAVHSFDHRRLESGAIRKWFHSFARCALLWAAPKSRLVRKGDWGYWRQLAH